MKRSKYFNYIEEKFSLLAYRIERSGKLNLLDKNIHAENFYRDLFNLVFDFNLTNMNAIEQNTPGIDLLDSKNKIIIQVSSTTTKQKIESALSKNLASFSGYRFQFIAIAKDASKLRDKAYHNPHNLNFEPRCDIHDVSSLLKIIFDMEIEKQKDVYNFIKNELAVEPDIQKTESNLATIIQILSKEDWNTERYSFETIPFNIEEKIPYNNLNETKILIDEFKIYYSKIDNIYTEFDKQGVNKSFSVLNGIHGEYVNVVLDNESRSADQIFMAVMDKVTDKIRHSSNYVEIPEEELWLCVQLIVVDAFTRCKIFKNPGGDQDVTTR